jgi:hypothetical protein
VTKQQKFQQVRASYAQAYRNEEGRVVVLPAGARTVIDTNDESIQPFLGSALVPER